MIVRNEPAVEDSLDAITDALLTASRLLVAISARSIARVDETITIPQFRTLVILSVRGSMNLKTLAGLLGVQGSTTGRMVERLVTAGLVDRRPHPALRRELVVELTQCGQEIVHAVTSHRREEIAGWYITCLNASGTVWFLPSPHSLPLAVNPQLVSTLKVTWPDTAPFSDPARQGRAACLECINSRQ
jgi:DNA-binding MarR family transcriptional regulator